MNKPIVITIFGFSLVIGSTGGCLRPCLAISNHSIELRTGSVWRPLDTTIYFTSRGLNWNSKAIARWFGTRHEADFGDYYQYSGVLGNHMDL